MTLNISVMAFVWGEDDQPGLAAPLGLSWKTPTGQAVTLPVAVFSSCSVALQWCRHEKACQASRGCQQDSVEGDVLSRPLWLSLSTHASL